MANEVILECKKICKNFGPTRALVDVDFTLKRGQVCGLIGENGSGKSTLTSIIAGAQNAMSGEMFLNGEPYKPANMTAAQCSGVAMVVQENGVLAHVDVAGNVFLGKDDKFSKMGFLLKKKMYAEADTALANVGAPEIKGMMNSDVLSFEDKKIVEIARAMYLNPDVLIIDETTTALATKGRNIVYSIIKKMKQENKAVIFISHDLDEIIQVCDTIKVLRDGEVVGHLDGDEITVTNMREMMVGRKLSDHYMRSDYDPSCEDEVALKAESISTVDGYIRNVSLEVHKGEILGIGGLANSGMHELGRMLFGIDEHITGKVYRPEDGKDITKEAQAIALNIGYISKDRDKESIILRESIKSNIVLASLDKLKTGPVLSEKEIGKLSGKMVDAMHVKCVSDDQKCSELSGGNKQKVAFSKWIATDSDVLIMDCPTRGIDIGVKTDMYDLIYDLKKQGKAIIMVSEELVELIGLSDRMLIMRDGAISKEIMRSPDVTDSTVIEYMI